MNLTFEQIKTITLGALESKIGKDCIDFYRIPKNLKKQLVNIKADYGLKADGTAGIRFDFYTDSEFFAFSYNNIKITSNKKWLYFTLMVDGKEFAQIGEDEPTISCGEFKTTLQKGNKRITLFFPNISRTAIRSVELSNGSYFKRVKTDKTIVFYGDSITQGYSAKYSANSYVNKLAYTLNAEIFNLAIAGATFSPNLIYEKNFCKADAVFVAYGTNDWDLIKNEKEFCINCKKFFKKLHSLYSNVSIYVILPIWRDNYLEERYIGTFSEVREKISKIATKLENVKIIDLFDVVLKDEKLFADGLHPNDQGFIYYAKGVLENCKI